MITTALRQSAQSAAEGLGWRRGNHSENRLALLLSRMGYGPTAVEQQFRLGQYRLDFALVERRLAIEADGWIHKATRKQDRERDKQLKAWGWDTLRLDLEQDDDLLYEQLSRGLGRFR